MLKVISFDVDGTLVDPLFADLVWLEGIPQLYADQYHTDVDTAKQVIIKEYDRIGEEDIRWYQLDYWFRRFHLPGSPYDVLTQYKGAIRVYDEVPQVLDRLSKKYVLIVASNAHRDFLSLTLSHIRPYFSHVFSATSDFNQVRKYEHFYRRILQQLTVNPNEAAHVGDHYTFDYEIPAKVGMYAFHLDRTGGTGLKDLKEFEKIVMELNTE